MKIRHALIIPVLNEAHGINDLIEVLNALDCRETCEIIVVDGSPDGDTIEAVASPGVRCVTSPPGRARQMNAGADLAEAEMLIFLHADTRLPQNALSLIDQAMASGGYVGGAFDLLIDANQLRYRIISRVASWRSRLTRLPYGDQALFIRRNCFHALGKYPDIPLMEDVALMRKIKITGGRICFIPVPAITSSRRWEREGVLYTTFRNWMLISAYLLGISPDRLAKYYRSGKAVYGVSQKEPISCPATGKWTE